MVTRYCMQVNSKHMVKVVVSGQPRTGNSSAVLRCSDAACFMIISLNFQCYLLIKSKRVSEVANRLGKFIVLTLVMRVPLSSFT